MLFISNRRGKPGKKKGRKTQGNNRETREGLLNKRSPCSRHMGPIVTAILLCQR